MYTLIISEKPSAAKRIAYALADGKVNIKGQKGASYFEFERKGKKIVVVPAVGHLFVLEEKEAKAKWTYPVFELTWKPTFEGRGSGWSKKYYANIAKLVKDAHDFISACDFDVEGSVIAFNILRFIAKTEKGKRMKFSTLTSGDLIKAYEEASRELDYPQIEAGLTRHSLDFLWGINMSRALTLSLEHVGGYWTLSTGRVQGPTLKILEEREDEIRKFVPKPFWELLLTGNVKGENIEALHEKDKIWKKEEAENILRKTQGQKAVVDEIRKEEVTQRPPIPFDLTTLQRESYSHFGYSPKMTLDVAQGLYEQALISYPRTSSQKLPMKLGLKSIIEKLGKQKAYSEISSKLLGKEKLFPIQGSKEDSAHPAIFPTGNQPGTLTSYQKKLYDLIVRRFLSTFGDPAIREQMHVHIDVNGEKFRTSGSRTLKANWISIYGPYARFKETKLPEMQKGQEIDNPKVDMNEKETTPPKRYSQASILKKMEDLGLGTKATRAGILQTLYDRDYIKENSISVTALGEVVIEALEHYCPEIISEDLTVRFEQLMEMIQEGKKKRQEVVEEAKQHLVKILEKFKENEKHIGKELMEGVVEYEKTKHHVGKCDKCGGELRIIHSKATHKKFVGCSNYPKCSNSFPLPQKGDASSTNEICKNCGLNIIQIKPYRRRPWKLCVRCGFANKIKTKDWLEKKDIDMVSVTHFHEEATSKPSPSRDTKGKGPARKG